ncbi:adhesion G-protein coupled receptor G6 isoform X1 [Fundulus heteroclitus]|uniref:adhesion G-protein coupled receptor G6 isoform X1 n=1 Tax=Fundulus heteroclitus TaxID=8078 RepID=UPI00165B64C6|nr:adhesion G-protein coupled receptor G6 isoform X1 [Fundulus heteroclitus]
MGFLPLQGGGRWRLRHFVLFVLLWMFLDGTAPVLGCSSVDCNVVLTEAQGKFSSPCYPQTYRNGLTCKWTMQAPAGFIVQLTFLDFELEEAQNCMYDRVVVNTGSTESKFCGLTASGLTLNSTRNVMELSFVSDFSIRKKGFMVSFQHVAVALRNQKVKIPNGNGQIAKVTSSIPALNALTICFEVEREAFNQNEWLFTYYANNNDVALSFGYNQTGMEMVIDGVTCSVKSIISANDFTSSMKSFCILWTSSDALIAVYFNGTYWGKTCSLTSGHTVPAGGNFHLGGQYSFKGNMYNFRLWDHAMSMQELKTLTCDMVGNIVDWDNSHWAISSSLAQTDNTLSCSSTPTLGCDSGGPGCSAASSPTASSTDSTNSGHATNAISHAPPPIPSPLTPASSMPLTPILTSSALSSSSSSASAPSDTSAATPSPTAAVAAPAGSTTDAEQTSSITEAVSSASTNHAATNSAPLASSVVSSPETLPGTTLQLPFLTTSHPSINKADPDVSSRDGLFYQVSFLLESELNQQAVQRGVALWLNQTFQNWTHSVDDVRVQQSGASNSYSCQVLLVITNESLGKDDILAQVRSGLASTGLQIQTASINVNLIENCPKDNHRLYLWPETKPRLTQYQPCFPNKDLSASRTCVINPETFRSQWSAANLTNCTVTAENAAGVAEQLANFTKHTLSNAEVSQVMTKVRELVNVAKIDSAVAGSVVHIISNVMIGSEKPPERNTSKIALRAVEKLAKKVEFVGPSMNITSKHLALGILALDSRSFNGTSFSAFFLPNSTDPTIEFDRTANPLAQVTLPASLLSGVSSGDLDRSSLSRINFMFFSSPSFFTKEQKGLSLNSYVVASSVGNLSIRDLRDPVKIEIAHLSDQVSARRECVFWDFTMNKGNGGWSNRGCNVSKQSSTNRTVCLCNHLTHFGILMDISQTSFQIDRENQKVLTFLSYIGCGISALCSAATLLTYIAFEKLRRDYPSKILMNLSASLLLLNIVFLLDGWLASMADSEGLCTSAAVLLHYFLLTSFTWMGLESVHMYIALVKVFNTYIRRYILKFCIVGWGLPAVLVGIIVSVNKNYYGVLKGRDDDSAMICWIKEKSVFYTTCVGYFCLMFLLNVAMFIVVMMQICGRNGKRSNRTLREEVLRNLRSVVSLTFLLGMTWGFALFAWGPVYLTFTYLFTIFNSLQGLFIFIFHCALKENVQKQWRRYLCCGPYRLSENSDWSKTATNNTKKVSSDNLAKSLSSSSFGSSTINWTAKAKATLTPFSRRSRNAEKRFSNQTGPKCVSSTSSDAEPNSSSSSSSSSSILPVSQMIDKVKGYCSTRTDNFYKNIILSDSFTNCTRL